MKNLIKSFVLAIFSVSALAVANPVLAATPNLSAYSSGSNNIQITINNANSNSTINLFSRQTSSLWTQVNNIGQTDWNGNFNQTISWPGDGSNNSIQIYATVGGIQSNTVSVNPNGSTCYSNNCGCNYNCGNGYLSLNQTNVTLSTGQTATITPTINYYGSLYVSNNSNPNVASAVANSSYITITGQNSGYDTITICANGSSGCATVTVNVTGNCYNNNCGCNYNCGNGSLSLSQTSLNLNSGQSQTVSIYNNNNYSNNSFYISNNSNSSVANASISGNQIYVTGNNSGTTTLTICSYNYSTCVYLTVTVNGYNGNGSISFSQTTVNLTSPQSTTVTIYNSNNYSGNYYISNNSNPNVASASISGNTLYINSLTGGYTNITVCQNNSSQCSSLPVNVNGYNNGNGYISLSQTNVTVNTSQSVNVYISGNGSYYISNNSTPNVASAYISGSTLYVTGNNSGSDTITVCQSSGYNQCTSLYVSVNGNCYYNNCGNSSVTFSQNNLTMYTGQYSSVTIYGNGSYYISNNGNPYTASASISGNQLNINALSSGSDTITVCQNNGGCGTFYVNVNGNCSYGNCNNGSNISFNPASLNLTPGQNQSVYITGSGSYYISNNNGYNIISANISGNQLNISALNTGSATITVCQSGYNSGCASFYVTVTGNGNGYGGGLQYPGGSVLGASTYNNGQLISQNGTVYIVYKNTITGFSSAAVFTGLGFSFSNVISVSNSGLQGSGYTVSSIYASHPWGSWVKNGSTVYFVHESGLIPLPNWSTFLNNGGQSNLIVNANAWDLRLPTLSAMAYNDSRLH